MRAIAAPIRTARAKTVCGPTLVGACAASVLLLAAQPTPAAMAVIDVRAVAQLVQQVRTMQEQLTAMRDQLTTAREELNSMTGSRGMERLLGTVSRHYLPRDWRELEQVLDRTSATYGALAREVETLARGQAVLDADTLTRLAPAQRAEVERARQQVALVQALTREALTTTSARFESIRELVGAIGAARDQKAILDLNARIGAEQGMLANEATKLELLYRMTVAEAAAAATQRRERAVADIGNLRELPPLGLVR